MFETYLNVSIRYYLMLPKFQFVSAIAESLNSKRLSLSFASLQIGGLSADRRQAGDGGSVRERLNLFQRYRWVHHAVLGRRVSAGRLF